MDNLINSNISNILQSNRENTLATASSATKKKASPEEIDKVARDFEAVFMTEMLNTLFEGIETDQLFGGGSAENIYRSLMLEQYGQTIAERGGLGIADHIKREMLKLQEVR